MYKEDGFVHLQSIVNILSAKQTDVDEIIDEFGLLEANYVKALERLKE